jgi:ligand-binding SRPBCC domain-containing protein
MAFYQLIKTQKIPVSTEEVWKFISNPGNLKKITPDYMGFVITSEKSEDRMYAGMIITYKVSPVLGIKMNWVTEISQVKELEYFVDEQRIGPYKMWHHQHKIEPIEGGTLMTDIVTYQTPFGILGALANTLFIKKQLKQIFDYRNTALEKQFGKYKM